MLFQRACGRTPNMLTTKGLCAWIVCFQHALPNDARRVPLVARTIGRMGSASRKLHVRRQIPNTYQKAWRTFASGCAVHADRSIVRIIQNAIGIGLAMKRLQHAAIARVCHKWLVRSSVNHMKAYTSFRNT